MSLDNGQRVISNLFVLRYLDREGHLVPVFALIVRTLEEWAVYPAGRRQYRQTAYAGAVYQVEEFDANFATIPKDRCFQTVRYKTTYATRLNTVDSSAVVNNHLCCSAKTRRVLTKCITRIRHYCNSKAPKLTSTDIIVNTHAISCKNSSLQIRCQGKGLRLQNY